MKLEEIIPALISAIPEFAPDRNDVEQGNPYLVCHDLVRFTFERDPDTDTALIQRVFGFWEQLFESPDPQVEMLLREVAWVVAEQPEFFRFKRFLGNRLRTFVRQSPAGAVLNS